MAKERYINTKFWDDNYVITLDPVEKLLYLYLLTNPLTNICGVYEVSTKRIGFDTGIDKDTVARLLKRFEEDGKVKYAGGWLAIKNFIKHQKTSNPSIKTGIDKELAMCSEELREWVKGTATPQQPPSQVHTDREIKKEIDRDGFYQSILLLWNKLATQYKMIPLRSMTPARKKILDIRMTEADFDFEKIIAECRRSDYLLGKARNKFSLTFDKIVNTQDFYIKILEGQYRNHEENKEEAMTFPCKQIEER